MAYKFGETSNERLATVDERLQKVARRALEISSHSRLGIDFTVPRHGGLRTAEEQNRLFQKKRSKADGYDRKSYHQTGKALDVIPFVDGNKTYPDAEYFYLVAVCMLQAAAELGVALEWGGNWKSFTDLPHYQIAD